MAMQPIEYADASPEVRAVYDDIKQARQIDGRQQLLEISRARSAHAETHVESVKEIMAPGALDRDQGNDLSRGQRHQWCGYCIASHSAAARKAGMTRPCSAS